MSVSIVLVGRRRQPARQLVIYARRVSLEKKTVLIYVLNAMQVVMRILPVQQLVQSVLVARRRQPVLQPVIYALRVNSELLMVIIFVPNVSQVSRPMLLDR